MTPGLRRGSSMYYDDVSEQRRVKEFEMVKVQLSFSDVSPTYLTEELVETTKTTSVFYRVDDAKAQDITFMGELPEIALVVYRWKTGNFVDIEDFMNMHDSIEMMQMLSDYEI